MFPTLFSGDNSWRQQCILPREQVSYNLRSSGRPKSARAGKKICQCFSVKSVCRTVDSYTCWKEEIRLTPQILVLCSVSSTLIREGTTQSQKTRNFLD